MVNIRTKCNGGIIYTDQKRVANIFNIFFTYVAEKLLRKLKLQQPNIKIT